MSVITTYGKMCDELTEKVDECIEIARKLMDKELWGYDEYKEGKDLEQFLALREARKKLIRS